MGLFTKREHTKFHRDETGKVVAVERNYSGVKEEPKQQPVFKPTKQLLEEYYKKNPKERPEPLVKKMARASNKAGGWMDRNIQPVGGYRQPSQPKKKQKTSKNYVIQGGKAHPIARPKSKKKKKKKKTGFGFDFDPIDNSKMWKF